MNNINELLMKSKYPQYPKKYSDWWNALLEGKSQPLPKQYKDFYPVKSDEAQNYYMKPEGMHQFAQAMTPSDLARDTKPSWAMQEQTDYPTSAYNYEPTKDMAKPGANLYASEIGNPLFTTGRDLNDLISEYKDMPQSVKRYVLQGVQAHEDAHAKDPRLNKEKMWSYPNEGYTTKGGLSGPILQREAPAMKAEDIFWYNLLRKKGLIKGY